MFWSDNLEELLAEGAAVDQVRNGVFQALDQWQINVVYQLDAGFGIALDTDTVSINSNSPMIDQLIDAASPG
jgi:hypothetical protein